MNCVPSYIRACSTTADVKDCEDWPARSVEVTDRLREAFESYRPPPVRDRPSTGS